MSKTNAVREPIATWFKIHRYDAEILPVKVVAFTASYVTFLEKQWSFSNTDHWRETREKRDDIFPSFAEAHAEILRRAKHAVQVASDELQRKRSFLGQVESLKEPRQ